MQYTIPMLKRLASFWPAFILAVAVLSNFLLLYQSAGLHVFFAVDALFAVPLLVRFQETKDSLARFWPFLALVLIINMSIYVRLLDYHWSYLRNIDSYAFMRDMELILENGYMPGRDPFFVPSQGEATPQVSQGLYLYQRLGVYSYLLAAMFFSGLQLWQYLIYFPPILVSMAAIPMYYLGKYLYDRKAGVLAAFFVVFDLSNVSRSLGGDPDSDAIVIIVPLAVLALYLFTYRHVEKAKKLDTRGLVYGALVAILMVVWHQTWGGYWYSIWLITGFLLAKLLLNGFVYSRNIRAAFREMQHHFAALAYILLLFVILDFPFFGLEGIFSTVRGPFEYQAIKSEQGREFPNVYVSVAELQESGTISDIIERTSALRGPPMLFSPYLLTIYALLYLGYACIRSRKHLDTAIILFLWFMGPMLATIVAVRFAMLFAAPMALGAGIILSKTLRMTVSKEALAD